MRLYKDFCMALGDSKHNRQPDLVPKWNVASAPQMGQFLKRVQNQWPWLSHGHTIGQMGFYFILFTHKMKRHKIMCVREPYKGLFLRQSVHFKCSAVAKKNTSSLLEWSIFYPTMPPQLFLKICTCNYNSVENKDSATIIVPNEPKILNFYFQVWLSSLPSPMRYIW